MANVDPTKTFFLCVLRANLSGFERLDADFHRSFPDIGEALDFTKDDVEANGGETVILQCKPVRLVKRGRVQVKNIEAD